MMRPRTASAPAADAGRIAPAAANGHTNALHDARLASDVEEQTQLNAPPRTSATVRKRSPNAVAARFLRMALCNLTPKLCRRAARTARRLLETSSARSA